MLKQITRLLMGDPNAKYMRDLRIDADEINALADEMAALSNEDLRAKTEDFQARIKDGAELDDMIIEACAVVREAAKRVTGLWAYDVQLMGAIALHEGKVAEMKTGEGKTLTAVFAAYINALSGDGVHIVTVNEYLAARDTQEMGPILVFLGLRVGVVLPNMPQPMRRAAYAADVTYVTNNEICFDYLRDNMQPTRRSMVLRGQNFAIVDEVDSALIDEARSPIGISDKAPEDTLDMYRTINGLVPRIPEDAYELDEKARNVIITDEGQRMIESVLAEEGLIEPGATIYDPANITFLHHVMMALRAHHIIIKDTHYVMRGTELTVIDELSGRGMPGRRFGGGLHQALEAKEGLPIQAETITVASVTYQNYFRLYNKLAGMTGTALTEAAEFGEIYGLDVAEIPTNLPVVRVDHEDEIYMSEEEKLSAIIRQIEACHEKGQPVLVGTASVEKSEIISNMLKSQKIKHQVLNARHHDQEAQIIGQAGTPGAITIATNMAGRGTDIQLGGNLSMRAALELKDMEAGAKRDAALAKIREEIAEAKAKVIAAGGVFVLGTERYESRRVDNQLRGRCGRQGDPGESKYFLSLEDDLMRIFAGNLEGTLRRLGLEDGEAIVHPWITKAVERAQKKVEARNFEQRKSVLRYDNVMNDQRLVMYNQRLEIMDAEDVGDLVEDVIDQASESIVQEYIPRGTFPNQWRTQELAERLKADMLIDTPISQWAKEAGIADEEIADRVADAIADARENLIEETNPEFIAAHGRSALIAGYDKQWREHSLRMNQLKDGVGLRAMGQRDPLNEYKQEGLELFKYMLDLSRRDAAKRLSIEPKPLWDSFQDRHDEIGLQIGEAKGNAVERGVDPNLVHVDEIVLAVFPDLAEVGPMTGEEVEARAKELGITLNSPPAATGNRPAAARRKPKAAKPTTAPVPAQPALVDDENLPAWPADVDASKIRRNESCPCGSGQKFKQCHGKRG